MNKNNTILITGATGLIGYNLYLRLIKEGYTNIKCAVHKKTRDIPEEHRIYGDLLSQDFCDEITQEIDYIFHCAAVSSGAAVIQNNPLTHVTPNLIMNAQLFEQAYYNGVKKIVWFASTTGYPNVKSPVTEDMMFENNPYEKYFAAGWVKRYTEKLCELYSNYLPDRKMLCCVLRPTNVYGPYDKFNLQTCHVLPAMIVKILRGDNPLKIWGDGKDIRDLIYVDDVIDAILLMTNNLKYYQPLNIGYGETYSINEIIKIICDIVDTYPQIEYEPFKPTTIPCRKVSIQKAKDMIKWSPKINIIDGITKTIEWYKNEQKRLNNCNS